MTCRLPANGGHISWSGSRDNEGGRSYTITYRVESDDHLDGPSTVRATPGLPLVGAMWAVDNDFDPWAFCSPAHTITQSEEGELYWDVTLNFATPKPLGGSGPPEGTQRRCNDSEVENPLAEPPRLSFGSTKYSEEAPFDRFGGAIASSSFEPFRGQVNEWDANRTSIRIEMNVATFAQCALAFSMRDCVNALPLWGYPVRCVKLSSVTADRKYYGTCFEYFTLTLDFDGDSRTWDRFIADEGYQALKGTWDGTTGEYVLGRIGTGGDAKLPNRKNPTHFTRMKDREGNDAKVVLNGYGLPGGAIIRVDNAGNDDLDPLDYGWDNSRYIKVGSPGIDPRSPQVAGRDRWLPIVNHGQFDFPSPPQWFEGVLYRPGSVVFTAAGNFVALADNISDVPPSDNWLSMPDPLIDRGAWVAEDSYNLGDTVLPLNASDTPVVIGTTSYRFQTRIGSIYVQKYAEANFLFLGIPVYF